MLFSLLLLLWAIILNPITSFKRAAEISRNLAVLAEKLIRNATLKGGCYLPMGKLGVSNLSLLSWQLDNPQNASHGSLRHP